MRTEPTTARRKPRRSQAERVAETRERLLRAAIALLGKKGYAGFRVEEVSRIAKVSRGAQTYHFTTKDSLVLAAVEQLFSDTEDRALSFTASLPKSADAVRALIADGADFFLSERFLIALDLSRVGPTRVREAVFESARTHRHNAEAAWVRVLARDGASEAQAKDAVWLAFNVIRGMAVRRFIDDDSRSRSRELDKLHALVTAMLVPRTPS